MRNVARVMFISLLVLAACASAPAQQPHVHLVGIPEALMQDGIFVRVDTPTADGSWARDVCDGSRDFEACRKWEDLLLRWQLPTMVSRLPLEKHAAYGFCNGAQAELRRLAGEMEKLLPGIRSEELRGRVAGVLKSAQVEAGG